MSVQYKDLNGHSFCVQIKDNDTIVVGGFVGSCCPETLTKALEKKFIQTQSPKNLTLFYSAGQGDGKGKAVDRFAHEGMVKRVIGGHWNLAPKLGELVLQNKISKEDLVEVIIKRYFNKYIKVIKRIIHLMKFYLNQMMDLL